MSCYTRGMPMQEHRHIFVGIIYGSTIIAFDLSLLVLFLTIVLTIVILL